MQDCFKKCCFSSNNNPLIKKTEFSVLLVLRDVMNNNHFALTKIYKLAQAYNPIKFK